MSSDDGSFRTLDDIGHFEKYTDAELLSTFDEFTFEQLMDIASITPKYHEIIQDTYLIGKYSLHERTLHLSLTEDAALYFWTQRIHNVLYGYDKTLFVLQAFGHLFRHIELHIDTTREARLKGLADHINKYCQNATQQIELKNKFYGRYLSLPNATQVIIYFVTLAEQSDLNDYFPRMESLKVHGKSDLKLLGHFFPYLKTVEIELNCATVDTDSNIRKLLGLNTQITTFKTPFGRSGSLLQYASETLPALETLFIHNLYIHPNEVASHGLIHYAHVKQFKTIVVCESPCWPSLHRFLTSIAFDELETFTLLTNDQTKVDDLTAWIVRNRSLKHLQILLAELTAQQIIRIIRSLPELQEISLSWSSTETLAELQTVMLSDVKNFAKISVRYRFADEALLNIAPAGWTMLRDDLSFMRQVTFVRDR